MNLLEPTPAGSAVAAALVVAGAPMFSVGLRVLRLRRGLKELTERPLAEVPSGFVMVAGRVALDSPLVGPLSCKPCAGFALEIRGSGTSARVTEQRPFRLMADGVLAQVLAADGAWEMTATARRDLAHGEKTSQNLTALLQRSPEAAWIAHSGAFTVVERALLASQWCWVIGQGNHARPLDLPQELDLQLRKTGTDDAPQTFAAHAAPSEPDLWLRTDPYLQFLRVSDERPHPASLAPPPWGLVLAVAGPLLSLTGLVYLARAAERWRALLGG